LFPPIKTIRVVFDRLCEIATKKNRAPIQAILATIKDRIAGRIDRRETTRQAIELNKLTIKKPFIPDHPSEISPIKSQ
tara:strand:- start:1454 stop:1687 length:234 start_codon:yes stop_codon:yes gene_type:complete